MLIDRSVLVNVVPSVVAAMLATSCAGSGSTSPPVDAAVVDRAEGEDASIPVDVPVDEGWRDVPSEDAGLDATTPRDAVTDRGTSDGALADRPDAASADRPDVVLPEIPVDPTGVPPPGSECVGDAGVREGDPTIAPPRPILPQSVSRVTSQRPSFRWALPEGTTGARVEVCADRCCTRVIQTLEAEGTTVRPTTALPPGVVYWRMFGRRAGVTGSRASYTWEFGVRRRDTPVDSSWGTIRDFTGDGYDDVLLTTNPRSFYVMEGSLGGPRPPRAFATVPHAPAFDEAFPGDFNGDGRTDLAYPWSVHIYDNRVETLQPQAIGDPRVVQHDVASIRGADLAGEVVTDWDGDGYSDLVTVAYFFDESRDDIVGSVLLIYRGSPAGLGSRPQRVERFGGLVARPWVNLVGGVGDVDLDGYGDVVVIDRVYFRSGQSQTILFGHGEGSMRGRAVFAGADSYSVLNRVRSAGDQDGDGLGELVSRDLYRSGLDLYRGDSDFVRPSSFVYEPPGGGGGWDFGRDVGVGDLNGDGFADLMVGSPVSTMEFMGEIRAPFNAGRMYVYFGSRAGLSRDPIWFSRVRPTAPGDNPDGLGNLLVSAGDLDADGIDDVVVHDSGRMTACFVTGATGLTGRLLGDCVSIGGGIHSVY